MDGNPHQLYKCIFGNKLDAITAIITLLVIVFLIGEQIWRNNAIYHRFRS